MHQRKNEIPKKKNQVRNTKLLKKKKTNNAYLMLQNHHQILENNRWLMEREREREKERERWYRKKSIQSNKEQLKEKNQTSISNR